MYSTGGAYPTFRLIVRDEPSGKAPDADKKDKGFKSFDWNLTGKKFQSRPSANIYTNAPAQ